MIAAGIFNTVEFYVVAAVAAAAVLAAAALPSRRGSARTFLYEGTLGSGVQPKPQPPSVDVWVDEWCGLCVCRKGMEGVHSDGAYSLAVEIIGFDVTINERITAGMHRTDPVDTATARMECFGRERYHFRYVSESTGRSCAFYLNISPGNRLHRALEA